jgi:hypothetical protein
MGCGNEEHRVIPVSQPLGGREWDMARSVRSGSSFSDLIFPLLVVVRTAPIPRVRRVRADPVVHSGRLHSLSVY